MNFLAALMNSGSFCLFFISSQTSFFFVNITYYKNYASKHINLSSSERKKSGQILISHSIFFIFSVAMILAIVVAFGTIRKDSQDFIGTNELQQVCSILRTAIDKIYAPSDYASPSNATMGKIKIDLPERIADASYRARFVNKEIVIETVEPRLNKTCETGLSINFTGSTSGGRTQIEWVRYGSGHNIITMSRM